MATPERSGPATSPAAYAHGGGSANAMAPRASGAIETHAWRDGRTVTIRARVRAYGRAARARSRALKLRVDGALRDRAANGRYAWTFDRGQDFAAGIWVIDPVFMIDAVRQQLTDAGTTPARDERYFSGARLDDDDLRDAAADDRERRAAERARHAEATASNLGLGHDTSAPRSPSPPTTSCTQCARSSAGCSAATTPM
jgi:hypothetical protein